MDRHAIATVMFFNGFMRQVNLNNSQYERQVIKRRQNFLRKMMAVEQLEEAEIEILYRHLLGGVEHIVNLPCFRRPRPRRPNKARSNEFWEDIVTNHFDDSDWVANFRMRKPTFQLLCDRLRPYLEPSEYSIQEPLTVEKKVAITLYKMASCSEYRVVANQFGVGKSTVHTAFYAVVNAINLMLPDIIAMPTPEEALEIVNAYEAKYKFPQVLGAIDGTHVPILPPSDGYRDYVNRKGWPSVVLQAVVDNRFRFRNISCKFPGSCHDARVLRGSSIFTHAENIIPNVTRNIDGILIPLLILGDPAYPLLPWLCKGYTRHHLLTPEEESFNVYHSSARMSVEIAFGRLKSRWRCLLKRIGISYKFVPKVVAAACALHNIVEDNKEVFLEQWLENVRHAEIDFPQPAHQIVRENDAHGMAAIRDRLRDYLAATYPLRQGTF